MRAEIMIIHSWDTSCPPKGHVCRHFVCTTIPSSRLYSLVPRTSPSSHFHMSCVPYRWPYYSLISIDSIAVQIPELEDNVIIQIACGSRHSMALTEWGQVLSWGDNECGQLGHATDQEIIQLPKIVRALVSTTVVQIACGNNHSLALTCCM